MLVNSHGPQATTATGFLALGMIYQDDGATPESIAIAKAETTDDRVDTVTRGLLGLTVSCARCHDHKFDPIPTVDYYALAGVFENAKYVENAKVAGFRSLHADVYPGGVAVTKPIVFQGDHLEINAATGAGGGIRIGFLDAKTREPIDGFEASN